MSWRIEPFPRSPGMEDGLAARIHDPLWLLARQWQLGEFRGQDAGTPASVRVVGQASPVNAWRGARETAWTVFDPAVTPVDALVEHESGEPPSLRARIEAGAHFLRLLAAAGNGAQAAAVTAAHPFGAADQKDLAADPLLLAIARRVPDGKLLRASAAALAAVRPLSVAADVAAAMASVAAAWLAWYVDEIDPDPHVGTPATWQEHRLEYGFALSSTAAGGTALAANAYRGDGLDWFDFDVDRSAAAPGAAPAPFDLRAIPTPLRYGGMPLPRFWSMEDARYDFGSVEAAANDIGRLLLVEFATVYGNDWFVLPVKLPAGTLTILDTVVVTDVFGRNLLVARAGDPQWNLFSLSLAGKKDPPNAAQRALLLPPTAGYVAEGEPVESVRFLRDEMADLAWAVQGSFQDPLGRVVDRRAAWRARPLEVPTKPTIPAYRVETVVPDYWLPLAPEQIASSGQIRLRLAAMEVDGAGSPVPTKLSGQLLKAIDSDGQLWLFEEEVPREGTVVDRVPRYARWQGGHTAGWTARRRGIGRGEGSSGLRFDIIIESS